MLCMLSNCDGGRRIVRQSNVADFHSKKNERNASLVSEQSLKASGDK